MATPLPNNEATFQLHEVAELTQGDLRLGSSRAGSSTQVCGVSIDTRTLGPGNLFVALPGDRFDGHNFVAQACESGARALVVERGRTLPASTETACCIEVDSSLTALGQLASAHRRRWVGKVVAVTGSAGKTTTRRLITTVLRASGLSVHETRGNLNNRVGVPMTLLALTDEARMAVIELGTSEPGEIALLTELAAPDVGLITLIAPAHTAGLGDVAAVANEKADLWTHLPAGGAIVVPDDEELQAFARASAAPRKIRFGRALDCDVQLLDRQLVMHADGAPRSRCTYALPLPLSIDQRGSSGARVSVELRLLGEGAAIDAAGALATVHALGLDTGSAALALEQAAPDPGRFASTPGQLGATIIDDTYNASPRAVEVAVQALAELAQLKSEHGPARAVAVLGDMKELGELSAGAHRQVGRQCAAHNLGLLVTCGPEMALAADAAEGLELPVRRTADASEAAELMQRELGSGDVVLVKGSRSMHMERVVTALQATTPQVTEQPEAG